jgi:hypothetical protein
VFKPPLDLADHRPVRALAALDGPHLDAALAWLETSIGAHAGHPHGAVAVLEVQRAAVPVEDRAAALIRLVLAGAVVPCPQSPDLVGGPLSALDRAYDGALDAQLEHLWLAVLSALGVDALFAGVADQVWPVCNDSIEELSDALRVATA